MNTSTPKESSKIAGPEVVKAYMKTLNSSPGVYRMIDAKGEVLYVGKAKNLRKRVVSYTKLSGHSNRIQRMIAMITEMVFITTNTETEALLLEANLIKKFKPRYNVIMRDDKSFPYILISSNHAFPQIMKHRGARGNKGQFFGPFASAGAVNRTLNTLQRAFLLRSCSDGVFANRSRPCMLYQIKRCCAPCVEKIEKQEYQLLINEATAFLKGKSQRTQKNLSKLMEGASAQLDFEQAAIYRDRISALTTIQAHQGINPQHMNEADVFAAHNEGGQTCIQVFFFRAGQNWGNRAYFPQHGKMQESEAVLDSFIVQFYDNKPPPKHILLSHTIPNRTVLAEALSEKAGHKITVSTPRRGERRELVVHALTNAHEALARHLAESESQRRLLEDVAQTFHLDRPPERIEVYDNSHISGTKAVGGMIVSGPDGFMKNQYRKFNIRSQDIVPGDDYGMMREVLTRRFSRLIKNESADPNEKAGIQTQWPDLVILDGGAGQLSAALQTFADLGVEHVALVSIAKGPDRNAGREQFFVPRRQPFTLEPKSPVLYYLQRLRDEAHRFAIGSHRIRRTMALTTSALDDVPGIGAKRKKALLHHFGSARSVKQAGLSDLKTVEGISESIAKRVYDFFQDGH